MTRRTITIAAAVVVAASAALTGCASQTDPRSAQPHVSVPAEASATPTDDAGQPKITGPGQVSAAPSTQASAPADAEDQIEAALGGAAAIKAAHGVSFTVRSTEAFSPFLTLTDLQAGSLCHLTYRAGGNVVDYMYAKAGIKYSFAVHLRDTGTVGSLHIHG